MVVGLVVIAFGLRPDQPTMERLVLTALGGGLVLVGALFPYIEEFSSRFFSLKTRDPRTRIDDRRQRSGPDPGAPDPGAPDTPADDG